MTVLNVTELDTQKPLRWEMLCYVLFYQKKTQVTHTHPGTVEGEMNE